VLEETVEVGLAARTVAVVVLANGWISTIMPAHQLAKRRRRRGRGLEPRNDAIERLLSSTRRDGMSASSGSARRASMKHSNACSTTKFFSSPRLFVKRSSFSFVAAEIVAEIRGGSLIVASYALHEKACESSKT
jgi:hypothetical protein